MLKKNKKPSKRCQITMRSTHKVVAGVSGIVIKDIGTIYSNSLSSRNFRSFGHACYEIPVNIFARCAVVMVYRGVGCRRRIPRVFFLSSQKIVVHSFRLVLAYREAVAVPTTTTRVQIKLLFFFFLNLSVIS